MDGLLKKLEEAKPDLTAPRWTHARAELVWTRIRTTKAVRRPSAWTPWLLLPVAAAGAFAVFALVARPEPEITAAPPHPAIVVAPAPRSFVLRDGSRAEPLGDASRVRLLEDLPTLARLGVDEGGGRFEVVPDKRRRFRVEVRPGLAVEALGTVFTVTREPSTNPHEEQRARVAVVVGRVRIDWPGGESFLSQGEEGVYPPVEGAPPRATSAPEPEATKPRPGARAAAHESARWQKLARARKFDAAFAALSAAGGDRAVSDVPHELLLAADVSRRAGHPREAVGHLRRLLDRHARDPRASIAAFTLGRVLDGLGDAPAAARAFADARRLAPTGPLAEDALAREAKTWTKAGAADEASRAARLYLDQHPHGTHTAAMERLARP